MKTDKNNEKNRPAKPETKSGKPGNNLNRDINRTSQSERFPESTMNKESRQDAERMDKDDADIEDLAADVEGTVGARKTGSSPDDIAGVADLDNDLGRSRKE